MATRKTRRTGIKKHVSSSNVRVERGRSRGPRVGRDGRAKVGCPGCGTEYMVPEASLDKQLKCKSCGTAFTPMNAGQTHAAESFDAKPYLIGGAVLVIIIGIYLGTRSGPAKAAPPKKDPTPTYVTGMDNPRVRRAKEWAQAMIDEDKFNIGGLSDIETLKLRYAVNEPGQPGVDAVVERLLADETTHWFEEFEVNSARLDRRENDKADAGKIILSMSARPEWSDSKGGKPYWYPRQTLELAVNYRLLGGQPVYNGWEVYGEPPLKRKRREKGHRTHDKIGKATVVERDFGGQKIQAVEAEPTRLDHFEDTPEALRKEIDEKIADIVGEDPRKQNRAQLRLEEIGKPAIPRLLTALFDIKMESQDSVYQLRKVCQTLEAITGQRFGFTSAVETPTGQSTDEMRVSALRQWFGYWTTHHDRKDWDVAKDREESLELEPKPKPDDGKKKK